MGKLIYLASPYNHEDDNVRIDNFKKISKIAADIVAEGGVAISPITYGHVLLDFREDFPYSWEFWTNFCLTFLSRCDELYVIKMSGWNLSRGVTEEIEYATSNGIPIKYIEYYETKEV